MADGTHVLPLATLAGPQARDDGDRGPNTGGMGAYSPAPVVTPAVHERIMREVMRADRARHGRRGHRRTRGFLYAGLMIAAGRHAQGARVQLPLRRSRDAADHAAPAVGPHRCCARPRSTARSIGRRVDWDPRAAVGVVLAAGGYPDAYARATRSPGSTGRGSCPARSSMPARARGAGGRDRRRARALRRRPRRHGARGAARPTRCRQHPLGRLQFRRDIGYRAIARE